MRERQIERNLQRVKGRERYEEINRDGKGVETERYIDRQKQ